MHIPDGFLDLKTIATTGAIAAVGVAFATRRLQAKIHEGTTPLVGVTAAGVFAAQMVNFPVLLGTSGHLLGGTLAAVLVGPWAAVVLMAVVLACQCFLAADGGVLALGANITNLALVAPLIGYSIYAPLQRVLAGWISPARATVFSAMAAAWLSVVIAAGCCAVQLAFAGVYPFFPCLFAMVGVHLPIGVGEAIITGMVLEFITRARPDLVYRSEPTPLLVHAGQVFIGGLAFALLVCCLFAPLASTWPDGLESVAEHLGFKTDGPSAEPPAPLPDYEWQGLSAMVGASVATAVVGVIGSVVTLGVALALGWGIARIARKRPHAI